MKNYFFLLILGLLFAQCNKENGLDKTLAELEICLENRIVDSLRLADHLIGEWELVHFECGFCTENRSVTGTVIFDEGKGVLNLSDREEQEFEWTVEPILATNGLSTYYSLKTEPYLHPLVIWGNICETYMVHDDRAADGGYHLFKKI